MNTTLTPVASAALLALAGALPAHAQTPPAQPAQPTQTIEVTGIRGSLQQSVTQKRNADGVTEVITAEDIGKMPDKNVADSLQRVPGVTISSAGANEGGFDENDRVSLRGTNPSLTLTLINGHPVSSGDWFVLNQSDVGGRSVSYTLLPSEVVSRVIVYKSSEASLVEGGVAGTVDIVTRRPLEFRRKLTLEASLGAVYADLPRKTDPQFNALANFKNDAGTMGVLMQVFSEKRHLRRDGAEVLGYNTIAPGSPIALSNPDLSGVLYPRAIGAAFFEQVRERTGGLIEFEVKPTQALSLDFSLFSSTLKAPNYNRNYLFFGPFVLAEGQGQAPDPGYTVSTTNGIKTLVSAKFGGREGRTYGVYDQIQRPDEGAKTEIAAFDARWRASDALTLTTKIGTSNGLGKTPTQNVAEWDIGLGTGASYKLNGVNSAPDFSLNTPPNSLASRALDFIFGLQNIRIKDKDTWAQIDGEYAVDAGVLSTLKFGIRQADHDHKLRGTIAQGPLPPAFTLSNWPSTFSTYPSDYASGLGGNFPRNVWYYTAEQIAATAPGLSNRDPVVRGYPYNDFELEEKTSAGYLQANLEGKGWRGNIGVRLVRAKEHVLKFISAPDTAPGAIVGSAFGAYVPVVTEHTYNDTLPSASLRMELGKDLIGRLAASKTLTRPDYSALAGPLNLSPPAQRGQVGSGNGSNPDLAPVRSTNFEASLEWYHAPGALLSAGLFSMDLKSYIGLGQVTRQYITFDKAGGFLADYVLSVPVNTSGKVRGAELAVQQPFGNFGVSANYTYADAEEKGGGPLVGASRSTYNLVGYYEDDRFNVRLAYNYRSKFFSGLDRQTAFSQDDVANVAASFGWNLTKNVALSLDARNLNNAKLKYFALNEDQPRSIYQNGRQYYLTMRVKL